MGEFFFFFIAVIFFGVPALLTIWNLAVFLTVLIRKKEWKADRFIEIAAILLGIVYLCSYIALEDNLTLENWDVQLVNAQLHSFLSPDAIPTVLTLAGVSLLGYLVLRFFPARRQPPLLTAFGIAGAYLGIILSVLWCVQTIRNPLLFLFPANCVLLFLKTVFLTTVERARLIREGEVSVRYGRLGGLLSKAGNLPWIGLLLVLPLTGLVILVLLLFGQAPNSVIRAWTDTADWTFSQKIPPQNIFYDEHYLCTVAAGGHRKVVKPLRIGIRHGHRVVVNRQLMVANAFEELLSERVPRFHRSVRALYDKTGYPLAKRIRSPFTADLIWFLMKPLEWLFLIVLYAFDPRPEDRIAVQYPHAEPPER